MKLFEILLALTVAFTATVASAINLRVERRDMKLATQQLIEKIRIEDAEASDDNQLLSNQATSNSATTTVTSFLAQPDVCRNIIITPGGTTADVPAGNITVAGTNKLGSSISETFTLSANQSTVSTGSKAFCTVTSVLFPIQDGAGATYDVGTGDKLGLSKCMDYAGNVVFATFGGVYESTRATCVADADEIEKNTCDINSSLDGSGDVEIFFIQNFRCLP